MDEMRTAAAPTTTEQRQGVYVYFEDILKYKSIPCAIIKAVFEYLKKSGKNIVSAAMIKRHGNSLFIRYICDTYGFKKRTVYHDIKKILEANSKYGYNGIDAPRLDNSRMYIYKNLIEPYGVTGAAIMCRAAFIYDTWGRTETVPNLAKSLGISTQTIYNLIKSKFDGSSRVFENAAAEISGRFMDVSLDAQLKPKKSKICNDYSNSCNDYSNSCNDYSNSCNDYSNSCNDTEDKNSPQTTAISQKSDFEKSVCSSFVVDKEDSFCSSFRSSTRVTACGTTAAAEIANKADSKIDTIERETETAENKTSNTNITTTPTVKDVNKARQDAISKLIEREQSTESKTSCTTTTPTVTSNDADKDTDTGYHSEYIDLSAVEFTLYKAKHKDDCSERLAKINDYKARYSSKTIIKGLSGLEYLDKHIDSLIKTAQGIGKQTLKQLKVTA